MKRTEALLAASDADETLLLGMIQYKGARGRRNLLIVEGHDDVTFVDAVLCRYNSPARENSTIYNSKGKRNVLILFDLVNESQELNADEYWFFIDADFDGTRGRPDHPHLWMTPSYSFENLIVGHEVIEGLLTAEYRCNDVDGAKDIENIRDKYFDEFLKSYQNILYFANLCAYFCTKSGVKTNGYDDIVARHISVDFPRLVLSITDEEILRRMPKDGPLNRAAVEAYAAEFSELEPVLKWRGKFLFHGFLAFLEELKKDRGRRVPRFFSNRQNMSFNPRTDAVRAMAGIASIPGCLISFVQGIP